MNRLVLIRHAQSEHHIRKLTGGWTDTPLSQLGRAQAQAVAGSCRELLAHETSLCIVSSDLTRAAQTAAYVANALHLAVQLVPALRELNNGTAAGLTQAEAQHIELPMTQPGIDWVPYPQAESWHMMQERVFAAMDQIAASRPSTIVVVTHGNAGVVVIQWWLRLCAACRQGVSFELDPASISELTINHWQERTIVRLNDIRHLALLEPSG